MKTKLFILSSILHLLVMLSSGCSDVAGGNEIGADTGYDTAGDEDTDVDSDADTDVDTDADADADTDAETDSDTDVDSDVGLDTDVETERDTSSDTYIDIDTGTEIVCDLDPNDDPNLRLIEVRSASNNVIVAFFRSGDTDAEAADIGNLDEWRVNGAPVQAIHRYATQSDGTDHHIYLEVPTLEEGTQYNLETPHGNV